MREIVEICGILTLFVFAAVILSGCQGMVNYMTDDMTNADLERMQSNSITCRDVSPPQLDNVVIRCS